MFFFIRKLAALDSAQRISDQIREILTGIDNANKKLSTVSFLNGTKLSLTASTGTITLAHGLGRVPAGWIITRSTAALPDIYETARTSTTITFSKATAALIDLWIY